MKPKPKPVKPRRMWTVSGAHYCSSLKDLFSAEEKRLIRPILVIDLSPESVEALAAKLAQKISPDLGRVRIWSDWKIGWVEVDSLKIARSALAAVGIRPSRREGSK